MEEDLGQIDQQVQSLKTEGKYLEALELVERGLNIRIEMYGQSSAEVSETYIQLCELCNILATDYLTRDDFQYAIDLLKRAEVLCEKDKASKILTFNNLACYYKKIGKNRVAFNYLKKALDLDYQNANTHLNLCAIYSQMQKHDQALYHASQSVILLQGQYIQCLQTQQNFQDQIPVLAIAYHNMGVEFEYLNRVSFNQMNEALNIYQKAAEFARTNLPADHPVLDNLESVLNSAQKDANRKKSKLAKTKSKSGLSQNNLMKSIPKKKGKQTASPPKQSVQEESPGYGFEYADNLE